MAVYGLYYVIIGYLILMSVNIFLSLKWFREMYKDWFDVKMLRNKRTGEKRPAVYGSDRHTYILLGNWDIYNSPLPGDVFEVLDQDDLYKIFYDVSVLLPEKIQEGCFLGGNIWTL